MKFLFKSLDYFLRDW